jgi:cytochrome P450
MSRTDVVASSWIFPFAGHETTANTLQYAFLFLVINLASQEQPQKDIDTVVGRRLPVEWTYESDKASFYNNMVGLP